MTPENLAAIFVGIGGIIAAMTPGFLAWREGLKNAKAIQELHIVVNSRLSQLLEATANASRAEGHLEGVAALGGSANMTMATAEAKAEAMLAEAEVKAEAIRAEAETRAQTLIDHAAGVAAVVPHAATTLSASMLAAAATGTADDPIHMKISAETNESVKS